MMLGAGHGGIEAIILGVLVMANYIFMLVARSADLSNLVPPDQIGLLNQQVTFYWSMPWYMTLLGGLERIFAIIFHLSASLLVLQAFLRRNFNWVWLAVLWHALLDAVAVFVNETWGPLATELVLAWMALISVAIIIWLHQPASEEEGDEEEASPADEESQAEAAPLALDPPEETDQNLEDTRFDG